MGSWHLRSPDGSESVRVVFRAGKARDSYFTNQDIIDHATLAMGILSRHYPDERHILIFNNATTHLKHPDNALSVRRMSAKPTVLNKTMFGVNVNAIGPDGRPVYKPANGKKVKQRIRMGNMKFADGMKQSLYFAEGTEHLGVFKGMTVILAEHDFNTSGKLAQCPDFKCKPPAIDCCTRCTLYNQPDFRDIESVLETLGKCNGVKIVFLPKFHCKLNPIEQCWGHTKQDY